MPLGGICQTFSLISQSAVGFHQGLSGFGILIFSKFAKEVLSESYYEGTRTLFNWHDLEEMLDKHISKEKYNLTILWAILTFQAWARKYQIEI